MGQVAGVEAACLFSFYMPHATRHARSAYMLTSALARARPRGGARHATVLLLAAVSLASLTTVARASGDCADGRLGIPTRTDNFCS